MLFDYSVILTWKLFTVGMTLCSRPYYFPKPMIKISLLFITFFDGRKNKYSPFPLTNELKSLHFSR